MTRKILTGSNMGELFVHDGATVLWTTPRSEQSYALTKALECGLALAATNERLALELKDALEWRTAALRALPDDWDDQDDWLPHTIHVTWAEMEALMNGSLK